MAMWIKLEGKPHLLNPETGYVIYAKDNTVCYEVINDYEHSVLGEYKDNDAALKKFENLAAKLNTIRMEDL